MTGPSTDPSLGFAPLPLGLPPHFGGSGPAPRQGDDLPTASPAEIERRAAEAFLHDAAADAVRRLYRYLEAAAPGHPELAECYPPLHQAIQAFRARDYGQALTLAYQVYRVVAALRSRHPELADIGADAGTGIKAAA